MEESTNKQKSNKIIPIIIGGALLVSLGFNAYQFSSNKSDKETLDASIKELTAATSAKAQLDFEFKNLQDQYNELKNAVVDKDGLLANNEHNIDINKEEIQKILNDAKASKEDLAKAQNLIKSLKSEISKYKSDIVRLSKENAILVKNNSILTIQRDSIQLSLDTEREERFAEREVATKKENELSSTLSISNHNLTPIRVRKSGKEVEKDRAKRVNKIRVSFDLDKNSRAETGEKEIYISVVKPDGQVGKFVGADAGVLTLRSGDAVPYSDKVAVNYINGTRKNVVFDWQDNDFERGLYKIDIYQNGFKISQADLFLR